jgi:transcriptional regulator with PAS, ATPase and Fis domain
VTAARALAAAIDALAGPVVVLDRDGRVVHLGAGVDAALAGAVVGERLPRGAVTPAQAAWSPAQPTACVLAGGARARARPLAGGVGWLLELEVGPPPLPVGAVDFHGMLTADDAMKRMFHVVTRAAARDVSVLVRGETGTGKELVAQGIHDASSRRDGPFRAINCAALPPHLLESELFGHVRGAFTGAVRDAPGHFRLASGGTLFLDEVAELSLELQAKLLRVLQERVVVPVGGRDSIPIDVRIVSATHRSLQAAVADGEFRADLMYRLRVVPLFIPPLRERGDDVLHIAQRFVTEQNARGERQVLSLSSGARARLLAHPFPGNVRELQNVIEYAFTMGDGPVLVESDLPPELLGEVTGDEPRALPTPTHAPPPDGDPRARVRWALAQAGGHRGRAAALLGVSRATFWRHARKLGLA